MENKEKYYTPNIMEICVGLECEISDESTNGWQKANLSPIDVAELMSITNKWKIRVKYLDKEDIESISLNGFEIKEYIEGSNLEFTWFKGIDLFGLLTFTDKMISFYEYDYAVMKYSDCIFRGTIKNKSELIKLMQQLNIK